MRALVVGAGGQLGRALMARLGGEALGLPRQSLDVTDGPAVAAHVQAARPDVVFNAAAYNKVDAAESDPETALAVNAVGALHLARAAAAVDALFVHVSTDYVFDGAKAAPYEVDDAPRPLGVYGLSKRAGEMMVTALGTPALIVRTSGVFGPGGSRAKGGSFIDRILARARAGESLRVVDDQVFAPTYAPDLAAALVALAERGTREIYHVTNDGACTWHELARAALEMAGLTAPVAAISSAELHVPARRPPYSVLSNRRYLSLGLPPLRPWRDAVRDLVSESVRT